MTVDAVIYYRVSNPTMVMIMMMFLYLCVCLTPSLSLLKATNNVEDFGHSTHLLGATTLRNVLGTKCLAEILSERFSTDLLSN